MTLGGFPELLLSENERIARRLRRERLERVFREDIRDLENVRNLSLVQIFLDALRSRVGTPIVLANLANELEISPITAKRWLESAGAHVCGIYCMAAIEGTSTRDPKTSEGLFL